MPTCAKMGPAVVIGAQKLVAGADQAGGLLQASRTRGGVDGMAARVVWGRHATNAKPDPSLAC